MGNTTESDVQVIDDLNENEDITLIEDESNSGSDKQSKEEKEDNTTSNKSKNASNKSNWKKMQKKLKEMESKLAQYEGDNDDEDDDDDEEEDIPNTSKVDEIKLTRFLMKNPEAIELEDEITKVCNRFPSMSFSEALTFIKADNSTSETHKDFSTKTKSIPKKLSTLTDEEALSYFKGNDKGFLNWQRQTGKIKD